MAWLDKIRSGRDFIITYLPILKKRVSRRGWGRVRRTKLEGGFLLLLNMGIKPPSLLTKRPVWRLPLSLEVSILLMRGGRWLYSTVTYTLRLRLYGLWLIRFSTGVSGRRRSKRGRN